MQITVHYLAQLKRLAAVASENIDVPTGCTLSQLLTRLAEGRDSGFRNIVLDADGAPHPSLLIFLNDHQTTGSPTFREGDRITLLTPMAGG